MKTEAYGQASRQEKRSHLEQKEEGVGLPQEEEAWRF